MPPERSHSFQRRLALAAGMFFALLLCIQCALSPIQWVTQAGDVHAYRIAAEKVATGVDPYVSADGNRTLQYLYPPSFVLTFSPLLRTEGARGLAWWSACGLGLIAGLAACVYSAARGNGADPNRVLWLATLLLFGPAWRNLVEGQVNGIVVVSMFAGVLLLRKERIIWAGILFAFAAHMKVLPGVVLLVLLAQKRWRASIAMIAAGVLIIPITGLWAQATGSSPGGVGVAIDLWISWIRNMVSPIAGDAGSWIAGEYTPWNHSFVAVLHRWFDPETSALFRSELPGPGFPRELLRVVAWSMGAVGLIATGKLAIRAKHHAAATTAVFGLALVMLNLTHAQTWVHHLLAMSLWLPLLAIPQIGDRTARGWVWLSAAAFGIVFSLTAALALVLPPEYANRQYGYLFDVGRHGIPTLAILAVWVSTYRIAWLASASPKEPSIDGTRDLPDDVETPTSR